MQAIKFRVYQNFYQFTRNLIDVFDKFSDNNAAEKSRKFKLTPKREDI